MNYHYILCVLLGLLPSLIWLSHYLKKDKHPEPNSLIIRIFVWGILLAPLAIVLELALTWLVNPDLVAWWPYLSQILANNFLQISITAAAIPAVVEETLKLSIVRQKFIRNVEFDEPTDVMIYCITAALGFAAIENLVILFKISPPDLSQYLNVILFRFLGATLVHAIASGLAGYWLAKRFFQGRKKSGLAVFGLLIAVLFHACYNYLILLLVRQVTSEAKFIIIAAIALLISSGVLVASMCFEKLKKQKSVCLQQES